MTQFLFPLAALLKRRTGVKIDTVALLLTFGLAIRIFHYFCNYTIWYDEAVLLFNILDKGFANLLGPLDYEVAAPPLFLWALKALLLVAGDNQFIWRSVPFLGSCLTLLLTAGLARRVLPPFAARVMIALVAFSDAYLWLGCCIKPYVLDASLATAFLYAYFATSKWSLTRRIVWFAAVAPFVLCLSYPAVFLYACLILATLPAVYHQPGYRPKLAWLGLAIVVLGTFAMLYFGPIKAQRVSGLVAGWGSQFPDWNRPWFVPLWSIGNTYTVFHYLYNPSGALCLILTGVGIRDLWRQRRFDWVLLLAGPVVVAYFASWVHSYPYGNNRCMLFAAPGIGVLVGLGISPACDWLRRRRAWAPTALTVCLLAPVIAFSSSRLFEPWNQPDSTGTANAIKAERRPGDIIGSDEGTYSYFFYGEVRTLRSVAETEVPAGTRLWATMDHYYPDIRHRYVRSALPESDWELVREEVRNRSTLFLFVRK